MQVYMKDIKLESGIANKEIATLFANHPVFNVSISTYLGTIDFINPKTRETFFSFKDSHEEDRGEYLQDVRDGYISISSDTIQPYMRVEFGKNGKVPVIVNLWNETEGQIQEAIKKGLVKETYRYSSSKLGYEEDNETGTYKRFQYIKKSHTYATGREVPGDYGDPLTYREFRRISWIEMENGEKKVFPDLWSMWNYIDHNK